MLHSIFDFLAAHKPTLIVAFGWLMREIPVVREWIKNSYPFVTANNGVFSIVKNFLFGSKNPTVKLTPLDYLKSL